MKFEDENFKEEFMKWLSSKTEEEIVQKFKELEEDKKMSADEMFEKLGYKKKEAYWKEDKQLYFIEYSTDEIEKVLSMLEEQDKIIDLMSEMLNNHDIDEDICRQMGQKENCNEFEDKEKCKDCIKQYFENKVKE